MKEKEIDWILNWIKKNPKRVKIANRAKLDNIKTYLESVDKFTLNDFKDILKINDKPEKDKYFKDKFKTVFVKHELVFGTETEAVNIDIEKIFIEESGRIYFKQSTPQFFSKQDDFYIDGYKYDWSLHRRDFESVVETDFSDVDAVDAMGCIVTGIQGRGQHKIITSVDWQRFLNSIQATRNAMSGFTYINVDSCDSLLDNKKEYVDFDTMMKQGSDDEC